MVTKAEEYRRRAEEAEEKARRCREADAKATFLEIAAHWRTMAAQAERNGW